MLQDGEIPSWLHSDIPLETAKVDVTVVSELFSILCLITSVADSVKVRIAGRSCEMKTAREELEVAERLTAVMWLYPCACREDLWWRVMCWLQPKGSQRTRLGDIDSTDGVRATIIPILFRLVKKQKEDIVMTITISSRELFRSTHHDEPLFAEVQFRRRPNQQLFERSDHQLECSTVLRTPPASPPNGEQVTAASKPQHHNAAIPSSLSMRRRRPRPHDTGDEDDELPCERAMRLKTTCTSLSESD